MLSVDGKAAAPTQDRRSAIFSLARYQRHPVRKVHFTEETVLRIENGKIAEEVGLDDGVTALTQLGILKAA